MATKPPLTRRKSKWAENRDVTLRGTQLNYNAAAQARYVSALNKLVQKMTDETKKQITRLFRGEIADDYFEQQETAAAMDASLSSQSRILMNALTKKFTQLFATKAKDLAIGMVNDTDKTSKTNLHTSLKQLSGGLSLKTGIVPPGMEDVSTAIVSENVSLIKSIPAQYFKDVTGSVMRSIVSGNGLADLIPAVSKYDGQTYRRAKNIALDQTRKAYNAINRQRMQAIGVKQFEWVHSGGGQHPRPSHQAMSGNIYSFDDLPVINLEQVNAGYESPVKGIPGQAINCKCTMVPVINFEDE